MVDIYHGKPIKWDTLQPYTAQTSLSLYILLALALKYTH